MAKLLGEERPPTLLYPAPLTLTPSWDLFHETTARLLFMVVRWVHGLAPYQTLSSRDQVSIGRPGALPDTIIARSGQYRGETSEEVISLTRVLLLDGSSLIHVGMNST